MNGCPAKANPKRKNLRQHFYAFHRRGRTGELNTVVPAKAGTHNHRLWNMGPRLRGDDGAMSCEPISPDAASLAARHVQAGIEELQGGVGDRRVDLAAVDAGTVDAGLRKFISAVIITFIDEDVVTRPGMT